MKSLVYIRIAVGRLWKTVNRGVGLSCAAILLLLNGQVPTNNGPVCDPCLTHCDEVGAEANVACVRRQGIKSKKGEDSPGECYRAGQSAKASCMANCFICTPSSVHPDFLLVSVLYAPPGNASSSAFGQSTASGVGYSITNNFTSTDSVVINSSLGIKVAGVGFGVSVSDNEGTSQGGSRSTQFTVTTTSTTNDNLKSTSDTIDHGQDEFLVWLNPIVTVTQTDANRLQADLSTVDGKQMNVIPVTANQLKNGIPPEKLESQTLCQPGGACISLPGLKALTPSDIAAILKQDPFLDPNPTATPDPSRYIFLQSRPLENTTVAGNLTQMFTVSDASVSSDSIAQTSGHSETFSTGASFNAPIVSIGETTGQTWTWSTVTTHTTTTGSTQQASVTLSSTTTACCGISPGTTCYVAVYEDMVYHTFAFVPEVQTCQGAADVNRELEVVKNAFPGAAPAQNKLPLSPSLSGIVSMNGKPLPNEKVVVTNPKGKVLSQTYTDHVGRFSIGHLPAGKIRICVADKTIKQQITSGVTAQAVINLTSRQ